MLLHGLILSYIVDLCSYTIACVVQLQVFNMDGDELKLGLEEKKVSELSSGKNEFYWSRISYMVFGLENGV